jgi:hypothetical protein
LIKPEKQGDSILSYILLNPLAVIANGQASIKLNHVGNIGWHRRRHPIRQRSVCEMDAVPLPDQSLSDL